MQSPSCLLGFEAPTKWKSQCTCQLPIPGCERQDPRRFRQSQAITGLVIDKSQLNDGKALGYDEPNLQAYLNSEVL